MSGKHAGKPMLPGESIPFGMPVNITWQCGCTDRWICSSEKVIHSLNHHNTWVEAADAPPEPHPTNRDLNALEGP